jgi:hypothetical protein
MDFKTALSRYGEALVFSGSHIPAGVFSFDKTVSDSIGGVTYTLEGFDVWDLSLPKDPHIDMWILVR